MSDAKRNPDGTFVKGVSGCPGGESAEVRSLRKELKARDAKALQRLDEMLDSEDWENVRHALTLFFKYRLPLPRQSVSVKTDDGDVLKGIPTDKLLEWAKAEQ